MRRWSAQILPLQATAITSTSVIDEVEIRVHRARQEGRGVGFALGFALGVAVVLVPLAVWLGLPL